MGKHKPIAYQRDLIDNRPQAPQVPQQITRDAAQWVPDVFDIQLPVSPKRVYIIASGPRGMAYYDCVPPSAFTIVVNSMVKCKAFPHPDVWMAMDHRIVDPQCGEDGWWETFTAPDCLMLFGARLVNRLYMEHVAETMAPKHRLIMPDAYWNYIPNLTGKDFRGHDPLMLHKRLYRGGLTVTGCAIQHAVHIGAREIILCGCDMEGQGHWDGFNNPDPLYEGEWIWAVKFTQFCNRLKQFHDVDVYTLSPSMLERTVYDEDRLICTGVPRWEN